MTPQAEPPPDLAFGSFSDDAPWVLDLSALAWNHHVDELRRRTGAQVPRLLRHRRLPPGLRVLRTGVLLGSAIGGWYVTDRRRAKKTGDRNTSRAGLSRRLRHSFERLGPTYIKLGQIISSGEGLFPPELVGEFRLLRDHVPAEPFETVRRVVEEDLGVPLETVFEHFGPTPLAAASIAQAHAATLTTGERVVVKVQRPAVADAVRADLRAMSWIAPALVGRIPVASLANPPALIEVFAETIVEELDFRLEAANMLDVAHVLATADMPGAERALVVPRPHPTLVTRRVLVMERLDGFVWDDVAGMRDAGIDTGAVVRALMIAFLEGATLFGVFHGDLHGGNLFVRPDGRVALVDYGITGRLDELRRTAFLRLLVGGTLYDAKMQLAALRDLGALPLDTDLDAVIADLDLIGPPVDPAALTPEQMMHEVQDMTRKLLGYGARLPKVLMLFVKNLLFLDGALATLAPDIDLFAEITHIATYFATTHGARIAAEVGVDPRAHPLEPDAVRAGLGVGTDVDHITYRELQERRALIRRRMDDHRRGAGRGTRIRRPARRRSPG